MQDIPLEILMQAVADDLPISSRENCLQKIQHFLDLLLHWNEAFNLTAVRSKQDMIVKHILDSLSVTDCVSYPLLDVGSGGGFPGIVLAIVAPAQPMTLLDSNGKKVRFLKQCVHELQLDQVCVVHSRVETLKTGSFNCIISRAYASLALMAKSCRHLVAPDGEMVAMKGKYPQSELKALPDDIIVANIQRVEVPFLNEERHIVRMKIRQPGSE